jgi:acetyl esterase/lipase
MCSASVSVHNQEGTARMCPRPPTAGLIGGPGPVRERLIHYGPHRSQQADLCLPGGPGPHPVVVLLHGGFWCESHDRHVMQPLSLDLVHLGFAVVNADYRRPGGRAAGWPDAALDAVAAATLAAGPLGPGEGTLDGRRTALVGHCGGGQLALWAAAWLGAVYGRRRPPEVVVRAVVSLAGITDFAAAARDAPGGGGRRPPTAARLSSPIELLPLGKETAQLLVHGELDERVPVGQSIRYGRRAAAAGDTVRVVRLPGADHLEVLDPRHPSWSTVIAHLTEHLGHCADAPART